MTNHFIKRNSLVLKCSRVRDWSLLIPGMGVEGNITFFSKKTHNPSKFHFKFSYPIRKSSKNFITKHVEAFYVLIVFTILINPIKNRFKDKQLTATYNLIALNLKESSHIIYVQY